MEPVSLQALAGPADLASVEAQARRFASVRKRLARSPLVQHGGLLRTRLLDTAGLAALVRDAEASHASATEALRPEPDPDERGDPDRWLESAPGGAPLEAFLRSGPVTDALVRATGAPWEPAGPGSWSYYRRAGHHLGVHRDLAVCDLAVITCVVDERPDTAEHPGGLLRLWPGRVRDGLAAIRADPRGAIDVRLEAGETILLLGGIVAHQVLPLGPGHVRIVAPLCYQVADCDC